MVKVTVSARDVKGLRDRTGAGIMDCKQALQEASGDIEKAVDILRIKGQAIAAKRGGRETSEGAVASYIHANGKIGVLVEVNCETDFVARNEEFVEFGNEVALQIAAASPLYLSEDEVPDEDLEKERSIFEQQVADKPDQIRSKIVDGKIGKWLKEVVLLGQVHINQEKHQSKSIEEMRTDLSAKTGENITIRRFARFEVGAD